MLTRKPTPKPQLTPQEIRAKQLAESAERMQQHEADLEAAKLAREQVDPEQEAFLARVKANHEAFERGENFTDGLPANPREAFDSIFRESTTASQAAQAQAEQERLAALTPRQIWLSAQDWKTQEHVRTWEEVNKGLKFPIPGIE